MTQQRWNEARGERIDSAPEVEAFLDDLEAVCRKHSMSIGHEDSHGGFIIYDFDPANIAWLRDAADDRSANP